MTEKSIPREALLASFGTLATKFISSLKEAQALEQAFDAVGRPAQRLPIARQLAGYVLPGQFKTWPLPARAAARAMEAIEGDGTNAARDRPDMTDAEVTAALRPIKAFLTRRGVAHDEVIA